MKIAISGSHGFIGKHLDDHFCDVGHMVLPIDRNLLYNFAALRAWFSLTRPDYIIHTAAAGNMHGVSQNIEILGANTTPLFHLLELARIAPYKQLRGIINLSSSSVLLPHQTVYSATKKAGEALCQAYANDYAVPVLSIRPYSIYGPGEADFRFIPTVFRSCLTGTPMALDPLAAHDWLHIQSLCEGIGNLLGSKLFQQKRGGVLNFGTGKPTDNAMIVKIIEGITEKPAVIETTEKLRTFDTGNWACRIDEDAYLWQDEYLPDIVTGLLDTYPYYKNRYGQTN